MKTTILVITFTCACFVFAHAQVNQKRKKDVTPDNLSSFHYDLKAPHGYQKMIKPEGFRDDKTDEQFLPKGSPWTSKTQRDALAQESMPVYKPEGVFSIKVIKPDTTRKYTMPVKKY